MLLRYSSKPDELTLQVANSSLTFVVPSSCIKSLCQALCVSPVNTSSSLPWRQQVPQWQLSGHAQLQAQLRQLTEQGAEALMLRRADARYRSGRSDDWGKLKAVDDAEAIVVGYMPGQGKYQGMRGILMVQTPCGQQFRLGSGLSDVLRAQPPALGSVVNYRHNGWHASGLPRFARFRRVRADVPEQPVVSGRMP